MHSLFILFGAGILPFYLFSLPACLLALFAPIYFTVLLDFCSILLAFRISLAALFPFSARICLRLLAFFARICLQYLLFFFFPLYFLSLIHASLQPIWECWASDFSFWTINSLAATINWHICFDLVARSIGFEVFSRPEISKKTAWL